MKERKPQMPNANTAKQLTRTSRPPYAIPSRIPQGKRIRLREEVYRHVKQREWILDRIDGDGVHLLHESKAYGLIVGVEDIDWKECQSRSAERNELSLSERRG